MPRKLIATTFALAALATGALAHAGVLPVAVFNFATAAELTSFSKIDGTACQTKLRPSKALGINLGNGATQCLYRSSVISDSGATSPDQDIEAAVGYEAKTPKAMLPKMFLSVFTRANASGRYEFQINPSSQTWTLIRDPEGTGVAEPLKNGTSKLIRTGPAPTKPTKTPAAPDKPQADKPNANDPDAAKRAQAQTPANPKPDPDAPTKPGAKKKKKPVGTPGLNLIRLVTAPNGVSVTINAYINGKPVVTFIDANPMPPIGRFSGIGAGNKSGAAGTGMLGTFDNVMIRIPGV